jgi:hypothetical protein
MARRKTLEEEEARYRADIQVCPQLKARKYTSSLNSTTPLHPCTPIAVMHTRSWRVRECVLKREGITFQESLP